MLWWEGLHRQQNTHLRPGNLRLKQNACVVPQARNGVQSAGGLTVEPRTDTAVMQIAIHLTQWRHRAVRHQTVVNSRPQASTRKGGHMYISANSLSTYLQRIYRWPGNERHGDINHLLSRDDRVVLFSWHSCHQNQTRAQCTRLSPVAAARRRKERSCHFSTYTADSI